MYFSHVLNLKNHASKALIALSLLFLTFNSFAMQEIETEKTIIEVEKGHVNHDEKFDPTVTILEHIGDSHGWHLWGHTSIPLPVILFTPNGLDVFSSSNLVDEHHKATPYTSGKNTYLLEEGHIKILTPDNQVNEELSSRVYDFSTTKNVASLFISVIVILLIVSSVAGSYKKREGKAP